LKSLTKWNPLTAGLSIVCLAVLGGGGGVTASWTLGNREAEVETALGPTAGPDGGAGS